MSGSSTVTGGKKGRVVRMVLVEDNDGDVLLLGKVAAGPRFAV